MWLLVLWVIHYVFFFFQAEGVIRDPLVTGVQTCALPICRWRRSVGRAGSACRWPSRTAPARATPRPRPAVRSSSSRQTSRPRLRTPPAPPAAAPPPIQHRRQPCRRPACPWRLLRIGGGPRAPPRRGPLPVHAPKPAPPAHHRPVATPIPLLGNGHIPLRGGPGQ